MPATRQGELFRRALPATIRATDDFTRGAPRFPLAQALRRRYIRPSPPGLRIAVPFDLDHEDPMRWDSANLPEPHATAMNLHNGRSHLVYMLEVPVRLHDDCQRGRALRFLEAIEGCYTTRLDADPCYVGEFIKNPFSPAWRTLWGSAPAYSLHDLAEWTPEVTRYRRPEPSALAALGRNCDTFDAVRCWAYMRVRQRKQDGVTLTAWRAELVREAEQYTCLHHRPPLPYAECRSIGNSVGRWTWRTFSADAFRRIQAARGRKSGRARREGSIEAAAPWRGEGISRATWYRRRRNP